MEIESILERIEKDTLYMECWLYGIFKGIYEKWED